MRPGFSSPSSSKIEEGRERENRGSKEHQESCFLWSILGVSPQCHFCSTLWVTNVSLKSAQIQEEGHRMHKIRNPTVDTLGNYNLRVGQQIRQSCSSWKDLGFYIESNGESWFFCKDHDQT